METLFPPLLVDLVKFHGPVLASRGNQDGAPLGIYGTLILKVNTGVGGGGVVLSSRGFVLLAGKKTGGALGAGGREPDGSFPQVVAKLAGGNGTRPKEELEYGTHRPTDVVGLQHPSSLPFGSSLCLMAT